MGSGGREEAASARARADGSKRLSRKARKGGDFVKTYEEGGKNLVQGWMRKKSNTGWQKRWFVLHERYLTWLKKEPRSVDEFESGTVGSLNLFNVEAVSVEGDNIVVQMVPKREPSRAPSTQLIRMMSNVVAPEAVVLKCDSADTAQRWRQAMYAAGLEGKSAVAFNSEGTGGFGRDGHAADQSDPTVLRDNVEVHSLRVVVGSSGVGSSGSGSGSGRNKSEPLFESKRLLGVTRLALGRVPMSSRVEVRLSRDGKDVGTMLSETIESYRSREEGSVDAPARFRVALCDAALSKDAVEVVIEQDTVGAMRVTVTEGAGGAGAAGGAAVVAVVAAVLARVAGALVGAVAALLLGALAVGALFAASKDAAFITGIAVVPMQQARHTLAKLGLKKAGAGAAAGKRASSKRQAAPEPEPEGDEADDASVEVSDGPELSAKEKQLVKQLRERLADMRAANKGNATGEYVLAKYLDHDWRLVRFVRARNMSLDKAEKFARQSLEWRITDKAEEVHKWMTPPEWAIRYAGSPALLRLVKDGVARGESKDRLPWYFRDRKDRLAIFLRGGKLNSRKLYKKLGGDGETFFKLGLWIFQMIQDDIDRHYEQSKGKVPTQICVVIDLEGFSLGNQIPVSEALGLARKYLPKILDGFPEVLGRVVVFNAPFLFSGVWNVFSPLFPQRVLDKISILGSSKSSWTKVLQHEVDPAQTPVAYGGTYIESDGDPYCPDRVPCHGPYLPSEGKELVD